MVAVPANAQSVGNMPGSTADCSHDTTASNAMCPALAAQPETAWYIGIGSTCSGLGRVADNYYHFLIDFAAAVVPFLHNPLRPGFI